MVKNLLTVRFANPTVEATLNNKYVSNVQITFKEPFGTDGRGGYFDEFGIIRDIQQNHLSQVLSLFAMEQPSSLDAEAIRDAKVAVLKDIPPITKEDALLGQYVAAGGKPGYLDDPTVPEDSNCPTFAALALWVNSNRWEGVPFILKAGKALNEAKVEIRVQYKDPANSLFAQTNEGVMRNELVIRIQPGEAVYVKVNAKAPGLTYDLVNAELDLTYKDRFSGARIPEAYETLIYDALAGDHSNFVRDDELEASWSIFTPLLHAIDRGEIKPETYAYGSRGPKALNDWISKYGFKYENQHYDWPTTDMRRHRRTSSAAASHPPVHKALI